MKMLSVRLPFFPGFYESECQDQLDQCFEMDLEQLESEYGATKDQTDRFAELADDTLDWKAIHLAYAKSFVEGLNNLLEPDIELQFEKMTSPREYNFSTDAIFVKMSQSALKKILAETPKEALEKLIKAQYTSYDGFQSYYPNSLKDWPADLAEWAEPQLGALLEAFMLETVDPDDLEIEQLMNECNGEVSACYYAGWSGELKAMWETLTEKETLP